MNNFIHLVSRYLQMIAVGTAATRGVAPLRLFDLMSGAHLMDLGSDLKRGAGMLDLSWLSPSTLLSCGYDTFTRLWDTRCRSAVRSWEEEYDESVYCLATDKVSFPCMTCLGLSLAPNSLSD